MQREILEYEPPAKTRIHRWLLLPCFSFTILSSPRVVLAVAYSDLVRNMIGPINGTTLYRVVLSLPWASCAFHLAALRVMLKREERESAPLRWMTVSAVVSAISVVWGLVIWEIEG